MNYTKEFKIEIKAGLELRRQQLNAETYEAVCRYIKNGGGLGYTTFTAIEDLITILKGKQDKIKRIQDEIALLSSEIDYASK